MKEQHTQPDPSVPHPAVAGAPGEKPVSEAVSGNQDIANLTHTSPKMSKGEKAYIWSVYSGLNMWVNLGSSVAIADYFCNKSGKNLIAKGAGAIARGLANSNIASYEKAFLQSQTALKTLSLLSGGWLLLIPMKMLEDNKRPIVHWLNNKLGVDQTAPDGHELTPDEIYIEKEQPKQSWGNVIKRRLIATAAVMGTGQVINEVFRDRVKSAAYTGPDDPFGGKSRLENLVVSNVNKGLESGYVPGGQAIRNNGTFQRYLGLAALDTAFTKLTAVIMKITNGSKELQLPKEVADTSHPTGNLQGQKNRVQYGPHEKEVSHKGHDHAQQVLIADEVPAAQKRSFVKQHRPDGPNQSIADTPAQHTDAQHVMRAKRSDDYRSLAEKDATPNHTLAV